MEEDAKSILRNYTGHEFVELRSSGDGAILEALSYAKGVGAKKVMIPDQGGWLTYRKYSQMLGLEAEEIPTESGVIRADKIVVSKHSALLYSNPAGYFAHQPIKEIYEVCNLKCLVIADVTGCIGDPELCDGRYADIMVGSFGRWKPVNLGYGGFISFKRENKEPYKDRFDDARMDELVNRLSAASSRLKFLYQACGKIKQDLADYDIIHADRKGVNVVVRLHDNNQKKELIEYCERNKYEYTLCPRYIRVLEQAISIEVKRL